MIKIFADYVMAKSKRVDITLKYDCENVLLVLPKKRNCLVVLAIFCMEKNGLVRSTSANQVPKAVLISASQSTVSVLLATKNHQIHLLRSIRLLHRPNSQAKWECDKYHHFISLQSLMTGQIFTILSMM